MEPCFWLESFKGRTPKIGNGRVYKRAVLEREINNYQKIINEKRALGECDHRVTILL